jgi:hypothetical protein
MAKPSVHPQISKYVRDISSRTKYPIKNVGQLMKALGEDTEIEVEGPRGKARSMAPVIPRDFFPVLSEEDLLEKSERLRAQYTERSPKQGKGKR